MTTINTRWTHSVPPSTAQAYDLQLLTIGGISVLGRWDGEFGEYYVGWAPLLGATIAQQQSYATPPADMYLPTIEEPHYVN